MQKKLRTTKINKLKIIIRYNIFILFQRTKIMDGLLVNEFGSRYRFGYRQMKFDSIL